MCVDVWLAYPVTQRNRRQRPHCFWHGRVHKNTESFAVNLRFTRFASQGSTYKSGRPIGLPASVWSAVRKNFTFRDGTWFKNVKNLWENYRNCQTRLIHARRANARHPATARRDIFSTPLRVGRKELTHSTARWTPPPLRRYSAAHTSYFTLGRDYGRAPIVNQTR